MAQHLPVAEQILELQRLHQRTETQIKTLASPDGPKIPAEGAPVRRSTAGKLAGGKSRKKSKKATAGYAAGGKFETLDDPGPWPQGPHVSTLS